ncbi:YaaL family protein [Alkalicoccus luteus]|uniref:YaaL family protein n=1 Tax=Alkalicoccus luteus TaxID=1237094 RepID=A0A969TWC5_9BACI|nr:YaaL family protein [Alkalicoccus luteus]NJP39310.1 YaaL family protein [Alkalicoccus luteus]
MRKKKRKLRQSKDDELIYHLDKIKQRVNQHDTYMQYSMDAREEMYGMVKAEQAKYWFLLREARARHTTFS